MAKKNGRKKGLTPKQARFVQEYLVDLNATQAAIRSGYSEKTAGAIGDENLKKPEIKGAVDKAMAARSERTQITADAVLEELYLLLKSDVDHYRISDSGELDLVEGAHEGASRAVSSIKHSTRRDADGESSIIDTQIRLWDKPAAIRLAMQHLGMLTEKHEHRHDIKGEVKVQGDINAKLELYDAVLTELAAGGARVPPAKDAPREPMDPKRAD